MLRIFFIGLKHLFSFTIKNTVYHEFKEKKKSSTSIRFLIAVFMENQTVFANLKAFLQDADI